MESVQGLRDCSEYGRAQIFLLRHKLPVADLKGNYDPVSHCPSELWLLVALQTKQGVNPKNHLWAQQAFGEEPREL